MKDQSPKRDDSEAEPQVPLSERLKPIQEELRRRSKPGGLPADKAFFDELSGDDVTN